MWTKIIGRKRRRKSEEENFKKGFSEEDGPWITTFSSRPL
jgi:hypothetical protein